MRFQDFHQTLYVSSASNAVNHSGYDYLELAATLNSIDTFRPTVTIPKLRSLPHNTKESLLQLVCKYHLIPVEQAEKALGGSLSELLQAKILVKVGFKKVVSEFNPHLAQSKFDYSYSVLDELVEDTLSSDTLVWWLAKFSRTNISSLTKFKSGGTAQLNKDELISIVLDPNFPNSAQLSPPNKDELSRVLELIGDYKLLLYEGNETLSELLQRNHTQLPGKVKELFRWGYFSIDSVMTLLSDTFKDLFKAKILLITKWNSQIYFGLHPAYSSILHAIRNKERQDALQLAVASLSSYHPNPSQTQLHIDSRELLKMGTAMMALYDAGEIGTTMNSELRKADLRRFARVVNPKGPPVLEMQRAEWLFGTFSSLGNSVEEISEESSANWSYAEIEEENCKKIVLKHLQFSDLFVIALNAIGNSHYGGVTGQGMIFLRALEHLPVNSWISIEKARAVLIAALSAYGWNNRRFLSEREIDDLLIRAHLYLLLLDTEIRADKSIKDRIEILGVRRRPFAEIEGLVGKDPETGRLELIERNESGENLVSLFTHTASKQFLSELKAELKQLKQEHKHSKGNPFSNLTFKLKILNNGEIPISPDISNQQLYLYMQYLSIKNLHTLVIDAAAIKRFKEFQRAAHGQKSPSAKQAQSLHELISSILEGELPSHVSSLINGSSQAAEPCKLAFGVNIIRAPDQGVAAKIASIYREWIVTQLDPLTFIIKDTRPANIVARLEKSEVAGVIVHSADSLGVVNPYKSRISGRAIRASLADEFY